VIIGPCTIVTGGPEPRVWDGAAVRVVGAHIAAIGALGDLAHAYPDETLWPARGRVLMPGFVNAHAHLARHLARGLAPRTAAEWRRFDRALSAEDVSWAAQAALIEGVRHGVTTVVDFHRSGACLDLSLTEVVAAAERIGVRVATCYGAAEEDTPLERRADSLPGTELPALWAHAERAPRGLLGAVRERGDALCATGAGAAAALVREGDVAWGSDDGANAPPVPDGPFAPALADAHYRRLFVTGARWASDHFGEELGILRAGAPADLILLDYRPATEFSTRTLGAHLWSGLLRAPVSGAMVAGNVVMDNGVLVTADEHEVAQRARECAARVWERLG